MLWIRIGLNWKHCVPTLWKACATNDTELITSALPHLSNLVPNGPAKCMPEIVTFMWFSASAPYHSKKKKKGYVRSWYINKPPRPPNEELHHIFDENNYVTSKIELVKFCILPNVINYCTTIHLNTYSQFLSNQIKWSKISENNNVKKYWKMPNVSALNFHQTNRTIVLRKY